MMIMRYNKHWMNIIELKITRDNQSWSMYKYVESIWKIEKHERMTVDKSGDEVMICDDTVPNSNSYQVDSLPISANSG